MRGFVIDENVIREAANGKKPDGRMAWDEGEFMLGLFHSPNKVFVNGAILKKFRCIEGKIRSDSPAGSRNNLVYKGLAAVLKDSERARYIDGTRVERKGLKKYDKEFVGVAMQSGGILVTSDERLGKIVDAMRSQGARIEWLDAGRAHGKLGRRGERVEGRGSP